MPRLPGLRKPLLVFLGVLLVLGAAGLLATYTLREARRAELEEVLRVELGLPEEAFRLEEVTPEGELRIALRRVALRDENGDTVAAAPLVRMRFDAASLNGSGPLVFRDVELREPLLNLVVGPDGEWNVLRVFRVEADGEEVRAPAADGEPERPILLRDVRITDGRVVYARPWEPLSEGLARFASDDQPERARWGDTWYQLTTLRDVDARLPAVRFGGPGGWRVEVAALDARVSDPDMRVVALRGWAEADADDEDRVRFSLAEFRTEASELSAEGALVLSEEGPLYDFTVRASPLALSDLQGLGFNIPAEGTASFALEVESLDAERLALRFRDAELDALDSRAAGDVTLVLGPEGTTPLVRDARLALEPLRLETLEALGLLEPGFPLEGEVRGTVSSAALEGGAGPLDLDVVAVLSAPTVPGGQESTVAATGRVLLPEGDAPLRLDGVRVEARPLRVGLLRPFLEEDNELFAGEVRGAVTLSGTMQEVALSAGSLAYQVDDSPVTRLEGLSGRVALGEQPSWRLEARADPLALGTLTALLPALPFQSATLEGPIALSGEGDRVTVDADLRGAAGALALDGSVVLGEPPTFDLTADLEAFRASGLLAAEVPLEGPVTGRVTVRGNTLDFRFDAGLRQGEGRVDLAGAIRRPGGGAPQFDVGGTVENFRIGALLGNPGMLPSPVTGRIQLSGGGRQRYDFDVDLRGEMGLLDLEGWYAAGEAPRYYATGRVAGLDLQGLPGLAFAPRTRLTGAVSVAATGLTPETFAGEVRFDLVPGSTIGGLALQQGVGRVTAEGGVLRVDTLVVALRGARAAATGQIGLSRPAGPLRFEVSAPNLAAVAGLLPLEGADPMQLAGAIEGSGTLSGTVRSPELDATLTGRDVRYGEYAFQRLALDADLRRGPAGWVGELDGSAAGVALPGRQRAQTARVQAVLTPDAVRFGVNAVRDADTELAAAGVLELRDGAVSGAILDTLSLRLPDATYSLVDRARLGFSEELGLQVENLMLRREGVEPGWLDVEGSLPPEGIADLRIRAGGVEVEALRRLFPQIPEVRGTVWLEGEVTGPVDDPVLDLRARVAGLGYGEVTADSLALAAAYRDGVMAVDGALWLDGDTAALVDAAVPMRFTLGGIVPGFEMRDEGPLRARIRTDSLPLAVIAEALPTLGGAEGFLRGAVVVGGTMDDPEVGGRMAVWGGAVDILPLGVRWTGIAGIATLEGERIRVDSLVARSGGGAARLSGTIVLDQADSPLVYLNAALREFVAVDDDQIAEDLVVSGRVAMTGRLPGVTVSGRVVLDEGTIQIPDFSTQEVDIIDADVGELGFDTATVPVPGGFVAAFLDAVNAQDLTLVIENDVWLESADARIQIAGELGLERAGGASRVRGELAVERGTYTLRVGPLVREFDIVEGGTVTFYGTTELNPTVDIRAANRVRTLDASGQALTVFVDVGGTLRNPTIALSSDTRPPLPESELLSLLIFGRRSTDIGALPQDLAQGVLVQEALSGLVFSRLERGLTQTGLVDYVRVRSQVGSSAARGFESPFGSGLDLLGSPTLELGKQVAGRLFVTLEVQNFLTDAPQLGAGADFQVSNSSSIRGAYAPVRRDPYLQPLTETPEHQFTIEWRRRWEYGRPRERAPMPSPQTSDTLPGRISEDPAPPSPVAPLPAAPDTTPPDTAPPAPAPPDTGLVRPPATPDTLSPAEPGPSAARGPGEPAPPLRAAPSPRPPVEGRRRKW